MTDRELLELAAKAAGYKEYGMERVYFRHDCEFRDEFCVGDSTWNPLTDDGDALGLAVKLRIDVQFCKNMGGEFVEVMAHPVGRGDCMGMAEIGEDDLAATRRAIVRAAAEIGKEQQ